jgi:uncharacterized protein (TIGR00251 family)
MLLSIQVKPNSKIDHIQYIENGILKIKIKAVPVDGKANEYLKNYLSKVFKIPKSKVEIVKGTHTQHKQVKIEGNEEFFLKILEEIKTQ